MALSANSPLPVSKTVMSLCRKCGEFRFVFPILVASSSELSIKKQQ